MNNALLELTGDALTLLSRIAFSAETSHFLRFGVMRRLRMIDSSFKSFQAVVPPNRTVPLSQEQSDRVCRDLNAIYIDLLGLFDNFAWVAVHQHGSAATKAKNPLSIGLFKQAFAVDPAESGRVNSGWRCNPDDFYHQHVYGELLRELAGNLFEREANCLAW